MNIALHLLWSVLALTAGPDVTEANRLYREQRYSEALLAYERLSEEFPVSAEPLYNAGNACYQMRMYGHAVWYYRKAQVLAPYDQDIQNNLRLAESSLLRPPPLLAPFSMERKLREGLMRIPYFVTVWIFLPAWYVLFALFIIYLRRDRQNRKKILLWMIAPAVFVLTAAVLYLGDAVYVRNYRETVIVKKSCEVKHDPAPESRSEYRIYEGWRAELTEERTDWLRIRLDNGTEGWIRAEEAGIVRYD